MNTFLNRVNHLSALLTTVVLTLLSLIAASSFVLPDAPESAAMLKMSNLHVIMGRSGHERRPREREFAFSKFDVMTDLSPLFHWNTKQVFLYLVADYSTPQYPKNSVVIWDRIVRNKRAAKINIAGGKQKYEFKEITNTFRNVSASFSLQYCVHPHVGVLTCGEVTRTEPIALPSAVRRST